MFDKWLTIDLSRVGNDIPTRLGKSGPTLTPIDQSTQFVSVYPFIAIIAR